MSYKTKIERLEIKAGQVIGMGNTPSAFILPEMTDADFVVYLDSLRIPEALAAIDRALNILPAARTNAESFIQEQAARRADLLALLDDLRAAYEAGDLDAADYERITSPQPDYSPEHLRSLRAQVDRLLPVYHGTTSNGLPVYQLRGDSIVWLTFEDGAWVEHASFPYSVFD